MKKNVSKSKNNKMWRNIIFRTLLFNFSLFLYQWSDLKRFLSWNEFKEQMIGQGIFRKNDYILFDACIDLLLNPVIRNLANKYRRKYSRSYIYRVGDLA